MDRCDYIWLKGEAVSGEGLTTPDIVKDLLCGFSFGSKTPRSQSRLNATSSMSMTTSLRPV